MTSVSLSLEESKSLYKTMQPLNEEAKKVSCFNQQSKIMVTPLKFIKEESQSISSPYLRNITNFTG
jgi:hypothetical protein